MVPEAEMVPLEPSSPPKGILEVILQVSAAGEEVLVLHLPSNPKQRELLLWF